MESLDTDLIEGGVARSDSVAFPNLSISSSGGLRSISNGEFAIPLKQSSLDLIPSCIILVNSSTWLPRGSFRVLRVDQECLGTGIAVASNIEATAVRKGGSFDEAEDDRRVDPGFLEGVRER